MKKFLLSFLLAWVSFHALANLSSDACSDQDIVLILDCSGSITQVGFDSIKNYAKRFVRDNQSTLVTKRFAVISVGTIVRLDHGFSNQQYIDNVLNSISALSYRGGGSPIKDAFDIALDQFTRYSSPTKGKILIISDGKPNSSEQDPCANSTISQEISSLSVEVKMIGVNPSQTILCLLDYNPGNIYSLTSYDQLTTFTTDIFPVAQPDLDGDGTCDSFDECIEPSGNCDDDFVTEWDLSKLSNSNTQISIGVSVIGTGFYSWQDVSDPLVHGVGTFNVSPLTVTGLPAGKKIRLKIDSTGLRSVFVTAPENVCLTDIVQWGDIHWSSFNNAFLNCVHLSCSATDVPDLADVKSMKNMFNGCSQLNGPSNINNWITSSVVDMTSLFSGALSFNQNIGNWDVSNVTDMYSMFYKAYNFNQNIRNWNTKKVKGMNAMFFDARAFNQDLGSWNLNSILYNCLNFTDLCFMLSNSGVDCINYSNTLRGWAASPNTPYNLTFYAEGLEYLSLAQAARDSLDILKNWNIIGDALFSGGTYYFKDSDGDTYGDANNAVNSCAPLPGYVTNNTDCDDGNAAIHPMATELCNGLDDDCDGTKDDGIAIFYRDADGDTYGDPTMQKDTCAQPAGYVSNSLDCNDADVTITPATAWYIDGDADGYAARTQVSCISPGNNWIKGNPTYLSKDCDDTKSSIHPNAPDNTCNNIDEDCDGTRDEDYIAAQCTECYFGQIRNTVENVMISGLNATNITVNSATLSWASNSSFDSYTLEYKLSSQGSGAWTKLENLLVTSKDITGLQQNKMYDFRVRGKCNNSYGKYSTSSFSTNAVPCVDAPSNLTASQITENSALLSWSAVPGAIQYTIQYFNTSSNAWLTAFSTVQTSHLWTNLVPRTTYNLRIWASCALSSSAMVSSQFKTKSAPDPNCPSAQDAEPNNNTTTATAIPFNTPIKGRISSNGDRDYYKFVITTRGSVKITLTELVADYDLIVYASNGAVAANARKWMTLDESVEVILPVGTYYVRVHGYNGAFDADDCYKLMVELGTASLQSPELESRSATQFEISAWPNPTKNKLSLKINDAYQKHILRLYTIQGKLLHIRTTNSENETIDLTAYPAGTYILQLQNELSNKSIKLVKAD